MKGSDIWGGEALPGDFERPNNGFALLSLFLTVGNRARFDCCELFRLPPMITTDEADWPERSRL